MIKTFSSRSTLVMSMLFFFLLFTSCQRGSYTLASLPDKSDQQVKIAVLPYEVMYTGSGVRHMTEEYMKEQQELQAIAFQRSLVNTIARRANRNRKADVVIQAPQQTNFLLAEAGLTLLSARNESFERLSDILGVDVLVVPNLQKDSRFNNIEEIISNRLAKRHGITGGTTSLAQRFDVVMSLSVVDERGILLFDHNLDAGYLFEGELDDRLARVNNRLSRRLP